MKQQVESILFISHEATLTGAPILLLNLLQKLRPTLKDEIVVVLGKDGPIRSKFEELATVIVFKESIPNRLQAAILRRTGSLASYHTSHFRQQLQGKNIRLVFSNTIANGRFLEAMQLPAGVPVITYVHELRFTMEMQQFTHGDVDKLIQRTTCFLAGSNAVRQELMARGANNDKIQIVYSSVQVESIATRIAAADVAAARQELNLARGAKLVVAIGTASWRKGSDWFVEMAARLSKAHPTLHFAWVGVSPNTTEHMQMSYDIQQYNLKDKFTLVPVTPAYLDYLALADVFVLSSREDPFPLVVLEAALAGKPTVCFADAGGSPEFVAQAHGSVVPYGDVVALADAVAALLASPAQAQAMGQAARALVMREYDVHAAAMRIHKLITELTVANT